MKNKKVLKMAQMAILAAIIILMAFTPLGYLRTPVVQITFITIPVCMGAIMFGPKTGMALGVIFGLTSFYQCFGLDPFGTTLLSINPILTFIACIVPRILVGLTSGLTFKAMSKKGKKLKLAGYPVACLIGSLTNTILFISALWLFFGRSEYIVSLTGSTSIITLFVVLAGVNALVEIPVCAILGGAVTKGVDTVLRKMDRS